MFTQEMIDKMDKAQVAAALKLAGLLDTETVAKLNARKDALAAPPAPTPFPKQAELTDAFENIAAWSEIAKALIKEARDGNHTWTDEDGEVKGTRKERAKSTGGKSEGSDVKVSGITVVTEDGAEHASFRLAADHLGLTSGLSAEKINSVSWRRYIEEPVTVKFVDKGMFESFADRMADGAAGKLPNWANMENFTLVSPEGETWKL